MSVGLYALPWARAESHLRAARRHHTPRVYGLADSTATPHLKRVFEHLGHTPQPGPGSHDPWSESSPISPNGATLIFDRDVQHFQPRQLRAVGAPGHAPDHARAEHSIQHRTITSTGAASQIPRPIWHNNQVDRSGAFGYRKACVFSAYSPAGLDALRPASAGRRFCQAVKEWTTKPEFSSHLVDHLPQSTTVPSPKPKF